MLFKELEENWKKFSEVIHALPVSGNAQINRLTQHYLQQNILMLNDILTASLAYLKKLKDLKTPNDIICIQARFTADISKKLATSAQDFLNTSLGHITDYNEWLKANCDLSTD